MSPFTRWLRRITCPLTRRPFRRRRFLQIEVLEGRMLLSGLYSVDGTGNNIANPTWGSAASDLLRISPVAYADGISSPSLPNDPSARLVSNILNDQTDPNNTSQDLSTVDQNNLSAFGYVWGQFIDHDMDLTPGGGAQFPIQVPAGDPIGGAGPLPFSRSAFDGKTGTSASNPRQQVNNVTSFLDLSQVYGSTQTVADALRTHVGGLMKTSPGNLLPFNNNTYFTDDQLAALNMANDAQAVPSTSLFAAGDVRANENLELTALQTLFVRNHNRLAGILQKEHPDWTDEQLYQEARKLNIATEQIITYTEYLPALLGPSAMKAYKGYNPRVDPAIATEFSTIGFRFGHSLLSSDIERQGNNGLDINDVNPDGAGIGLSQDFFDPTLLNPNGIVDPLTGHTSSDIGAVLKGAADNNAQAMDLMAIRDVRDLLFGNGAFGGQDLMARDVQRARDHGIGSYNQVRVAYGLPAVTSFAQITSNVTIQKELQQAYGTVANIDPFEGGLAEDHVNGSDMGPLFTRILADQFTRLRDGDRFFYLNQQFNKDELNLLGGGNTLTKVIEANTDITNLQPNAMIFRASISGTVNVDAGGGNRGRLTGLAGATVQLKDDSGNVRATTVTDRAGRYHFDQQNGLSATGNYSVTLVVPSGYMQTSPNPSTILIDKSGVDMDGVNYTVINTQAVPVTATHLQVTAPQNIQSGVSFDIVVAAEDASNHVAAGYTGTVHFSLTTADEGASLPADYTFTTSDHGIHRFHLTLVATGAQTITASDTRTASITGSASITVNPAPVATQLLVVTRDHATAGLPTPVTIVALDASGHPVPNYAGTVSLTTSDPKATLPPSYTFTASDHGRNTFTVTFQTPGSQTVTASDGKNSGQAALMVDAVGAVTHLGVFLVGPAIAGSPARVEVVALDANNHVVAGYTGTVHFTSSDSEATLPADYTFSASDNGSHLFSVTFAATGDQTLTVTETKTSSITGTRKVRVRARFR